MVPAPGNSFRSLCLALGKTEVEARDSRIESIRPLISGMGYPITREWTQLGQRGFRCELLHGEVHLITSHSSHLESLWVGLESSLIPWRASPTKDLEAELLFGTSLESRSDLGEGVLGICIGGMLSISTVIAAAMKYTSMPLHQRSEDAFLKLWTDEERSKHRERFAWFSAIYAFQKK